MHKKTTVITTLIFVHIRNIELLKNKTYLAYKNCMKQQYKKAQIQQDMEHYCGLKYET